MSVHQINVCGRKVGRVRNVLGAIVIVGALAGCASIPRLWVNDAGEMRRCGATSWGWGLAGAAAALGAKRANAECAQDLRRLGYVPLPTVRTGIVLKSPLRIERLIAGSPAERGGLKVGDTLTAADNREIRTITDFVMVLNGKHPGDPISIRVDRDGAPVTVSIVVVEEPQ